MGQSIRYQTYTPAGDVIVISICLVMMILIVYSYIKQTKSYRIFLTVMGLVMLAAYANILLHALARSHAS